MLRASCLTPETLRIGAVCASPPSNPGFEPGLALIALADAVCSKDPTRLATARANFVRHTPQYVAAAVAVAANFQMMNRILDATGVPINDRFADIGRELGFEERDWTRQNHALA